MGNLRLNSVQVVDSVTIAAKFTNKLSPYIDKTNVAIESQLDSVPSPKVIAVEIYENTLTVTSGPLTPACPYFIKFASSSVTDFKSLNGDQFLDGQDPTSKKLIIGPAEAENPIQQYLYSYLQDNLYNVTDTTTNIHKVVQGMSLLLSKALYDIKQVKNENYLSITVKDEAKTRGQGPFDRLNEEGAYEIIRVSKNKTGEMYQSSSNVKFFTNNKITLQAKNNTDTLSLYDKDDVGFFNYKTFTLNVSKPFAIKLESVEFVYSDGRPTYTYDVENLGYKLLDPTYDNLYSYPYRSLSSNQIRLDESIFLAGAVSLTNPQNIKINVSYQYKDPGRYISPNSLSVTSVMKSIREEIPPAISVFNLSHAPIVDENDNLCQSGGLTLFNMNSLRPSDPHPAFLKEKIFKLDALPSLPGEFAVDYLTGTVYVYGESEFNHGTGSSPPLATYSYRYTYKDSVDYTYDAESYDLAALLNGNLIQNSAKVSFEYEDVLTNGIDYKAEVHKEVIGERIQNKILSDGSVRVSNSPVTNVFRIFNETSGEVYTPYRWNNDRVYYSYINPPNFDKITGERASFSDVYGELLFRDTVTTNASSKRIITIKLSNRNIISKSEDCIGSLINSSVVFSNKDVFAHEKWFDASSASNKDRLLNIGDYQIDYRNGVVYVVVDPDPTKEPELGSINYKKPYIKTSNKHITNVNDIYYNIDGVSKISKKLAYTSFSDTEVLVKDKDFDLSDERYVNLNNTICNTASLLPGVSGQIKSIRSIHEIQDLNNNPNPINFAAEAEASGNLIKINPIILSNHDYVKFNQADGYYVDLSISSPTISPQISFVVSVTRDSDGANFTCAIKPGSPVRVLLSNNSPSVNDFVFVRANISIKNTSSVIVDYNRGEFYIDYVHLTDEILVSYEYGENHIDFRQSSSISNGDNYYVSYKVGALRDALLANFGSVANLPELNNQDLELNRERYRDAVGAVFEAIKDGPTARNIKNVVKKMAHVEPEIKESLFGGWSLGSSLLSPRSISTRGTFDFGKGKYDKGILIDKDDSTITVPVSSNFRLESGTFQSWIIPNWDGIDNNADITFYITTFPAPNRQDHYDLRNVFVGASEYHPQYDLADGYKFTLNKSKVMPGRPNLNKNGIFIFYDKDASGLFDRWYVSVVEDSIQDNIKISITTNGKLYDVKAIPGTNPSAATTKLSSSNASLSLDIERGTNIAKDICFVADKDHYILDFAESDAKNRFSLFKDPSGFINFRVIDRFGSQYSISSDISRWRKKDLHHIAISWSINSKNNQDEMHLFIDGIEVPNIVKYGVRNSVVGHEKFRALNNEEIAGFVDKRIVSSNDMMTFSGQPSVIVTNASLSGISPGDTLFIMEQGFNRAGYTILSIVNQTIQLASTMPLSLSDARYTINQRKIPLRPEFDNYTKFIVSKISATYSGTDLSVTSGQYQATSTSYNFQAQNIKAGDIITINNGTSSVRRTILTVTGNSVTVDDPITFTSNSCAFDVYKNVEKELRGPQSINPSYSVQESAPGRYDLVLLDDLLPKDILTIKKLGLKEKRVTQLYYNWANSSSIKTALAQPTSPSSVRITNILLPSVALKPPSASSSTVTINGNNFSYSTLTNNISVGKFSTTDARSVVVRMSTDNVDYSQPLQVQIVGLPNSETIAFSSPGAIKSTQKFTSISDVIVSGTFISPSKTYLTLELREHLPITEPEDLADQNFAAIRYSYQVRAGLNLRCSDGVRLYDSSPWQPSLVGGHIKIPSINSIFRIKNVDLDSLGNSYLEVYSSNPIPPISGESYEIVDASNKYSGFQNGHIYLEKANYPGEPFTLPKGTYEVDIRMPLSIKLDAAQGDAFFGTDFKGKSNVDGILDEIKINIDKLTDTRIGEQVDSNQETITKNFHSLKRLTPNKNTLLLCHLNNLPLENEAPFYLMLKNKRMLEPGASVNDNFDRSVYLKDKPIIIENNGILNPGKEGTIEFWVSPMFDSVNDYQERFYFDATSLIKEDVISLNDSTVQVAGNVGKVIKVSLKNGDDAIDYFAGGSVEISPSDALVETIDMANDTFIPESSVSFEVIEDRTGFYYFSGNKASLSIYADNNNISHPNIGILTIDPNHISPPSLNLALADMVGKRLRIVNPKNKSNENVYSIVEYDPTTFKLKILNDMDFYCTLPPSSPKVMQVISVKLFNDPSSTDYFQGGTIGKDGRTIYFGKNLPAYTVPFGKNRPDKKIIVTYKPNEGPRSSLNSKIIRLNKKLPSQKSNVTVTYIPSGLNGDRMSIYKDSSGFLNYSIVASGTEYKIRAPIFWPRNTWHRIKATYRVNTEKNTDEMSLCVDGYEYGNITFNTSVSTAGQYVFGSTYAGSGIVNSSIRVKDFFNNLYFGSDSNEKNNAYCLIDNLRISNVSRPKFIAFGQSIDVNYNKNTSVALPVKKDVYTTLLWDFDSILVKTDDFASLVNKKSGGSDFSINIFDSFGIINSSAKVKEITEKLIKILKPANSRVFLKYFD